MPVARITITRHRLDTQAMAFLMARALDLLRALEPDRAELLGHRGITTFLMGGTCRFGTDPAASVLDPDCRAHDVPNLYVTDGSFLPTSGGVPLTLTILANAFRVARRIARRCKAHPRGE
jgi:choline dehydrogenase-like flavoprotein